MKLGIIGTGHIGATVAKLFAEAGHELAISNSRGPQTLRELAGELGPKVRAVTPKEAAAFGEVVLEAIPFGRYRDLPSLARQGLAARSSSRRRTTTPAATVRWTLAASARAN